MPVGNLQNDRSQRAALAELQVTAAGLPASLALKQNVTFAPNELGLGTVERALAATLADVVSTAPSGWAQVYQTNTGTGNDGTSALDKQEISAGGTVAAPTRTISGSNPYVAFGLALLPA